MAGEKISSSIDLVGTYSNEDECVKKLCQVRTAAGWTCPKWGAPAPSFLLGRRKAQCQKRPLQEAVAKGAAMYRSRHFASLFLKNMRFYAGARP